MQILDKFQVNQMKIMSGVGLMVVDLGSKGPEFKSWLAVELIPGGVDSACHPSEVGESEYQLAGMIEPLEYPVSEWWPIQDCAKQPRRPASVAVMLCTEYGPNGWMEILLMGNKCDYFYDVISAFVMTS